MQIPFGEWLPDQPEYLNPGATVANNVYFAQTSYKRFPSLLIIQLILFQQIVEVLVLLEIILIQYLILLQLIQTYMN